jgi:hypothetical protein
MWHCSHQPLARGDISGQAATARSIAQAINPWLDVGHILKPAARKRHHVLGMKNGIGAHPGGSWRFLRDLLPTT